MYSFCVNLNKARKSLVNQFLDGKNDVFEFIFGDDRFQIVIY
jgi:hypothetical protein